MIVNNTYSCACSVQCCRKMFWKSAKKEPKNSNGYSTALVHQDPRTKVRTASAATETTNTTERNATIFDNLRNKVTQQTVRQTVTHQQTARVTEISIRRTPTKEELDELLNVSGANATFFKSSTPWSKQETTVTQINGQSETSFVQQQHTKLNQRSTTTNTATKGAEKSRSTTKVFAGSESRTKVPNYTDSFGIISPLRALAPPSTPAVVSSAPLSHTTLTTYNTPLTKYNANQNGSMNNSYSAGSTTRKVAASPTWSKTATGASNDFSTSGTAPTNAKTTTISTLTTSNYVSPYANRIRGPLATSYTYAQSKPAGTLITTMSETHARADANPTATSKQIKTNQPPIEIMVKPLPQLKYHTRLTETSTKPQNTIGMISGIKSKLRPGYAVIFNSVDFADKERFEKRDGSDYDAKIIRETLEQYKLKVDTIKNPTVKKIKDFVKSLTKKDYTHYSCLIIAILSHGSLHDSIAASDGEYNVDDTMLYPLLDIPSLKEKPKIFIIQACKGALVPGEYKKDASVARGSPSEILKCYSTFEGYVSYRTEKGSPFVQALCEEIKLKGQNTDIEQLMKNAIESVKIRTRSNQIPCMTTNLTKPFVFGNYV
ncbi:uncharacterized protein [Eurosta solidaginis]|uniref:uncharacterized protein n=1 Tax=Eurosta solidaginis TaxID=178769 RepID=UPI003530BB69